VNYFEHHIGDYAAATSHLTWDEDMAYTRLLRHYYHNERGIADGEKYRVARTEGSKARKAAVDAVLAEFFKLADGVWRQKRAEEVIAAYREVQKDVDTKREHETDRKRRYRERRSQLFETLRERGIVPSFDTQTDELERLVSRGTNAGQVRDGDGDGTGTSEGVHGYPSPTTHLPDITTNVVASVEGSQGDKPRQARAPKPSTVICKAVIAAGMPSALVNPSHPSLLELVEQGVTPDQFADTVRELIERNGEPPKFGYLLGTIRGRLIDASRTPRIAAGATLTNGSKPSKALVGLHAIEDLKNGFEDEDSDGDGTAKARLARLTVDACG
jgi:uncharacterized protein YdaU (DUF1376 family)